MRVLDIGLLGLPGARLAEGFEIPGKPHLGVAARGGPSYASAAVLWDRRQIPSARVVQQVGSDRR
eukprot:4847933-Pyramimonas_sp.AAC.1